MDKPTVLKPDPQWVFDCGAYYVIFVARKFTFLITFCEFSFEDAFAELSVTIEGHVGGRGGRLGPEATGLRPRAIPKGGSCPPPTPLPAHLTSRALCLISCSTWYMKTTGH